MADRTEGALQAAIKALETAVLPAVNPADPLAGEQLRLAIGYLRLVRSRLDHLEDRAHFELAHCRQLALALREEAHALGGEPAQRLDAALAQADAAVRPAQVRAASAALSAAVSGLVRAAAQGDADRRRRIELTVARDSRRWVTAQRAWFTPLGFDLRPGELPELADALRPPGAAA